MTHPMQPLELVNKVIRFKENKIIDYLFRTGKIDLNELAKINFPAEDRMQFAQLLGYSVSGYASLSYASQESVEESQAQAEELMAKQG